VLPPAGNQAPCQLGGLLQRFDNQTLFPTLLDFTASPMATALIARAENSRYD
jgi:hypothetical protein